MHFSSLRLSGWAQYATFSGAILILTAPMIIISKTASAPGYIQHQALNSRAVHMIGPSPSSTPQANSAVKGVSTLNLQLPQEHDGLSESKEPQLRTLAQYEQVAGGAVASGMMFFTRYSDSISSAKTDATDMMATLQEFAKYNLTPLIIMEPTNSNGSLDFKTYRNGEYDNIVDTYFQTLKNLGATDSEIGIWTYFPEANMPEWGPVDTGDFSANVTRTVNIQKKYFPTSKASIMLDAESYPNGATSWSAGSYPSLTPFISGIPAGLLDYFGLQGFPWAPPANVSGEAPSYNPAIYLKGSLAVEAANNLGVKNIWFNTGTFAAMYTNSPTQTVYLTSSQRQELLNGVLAQAITVANQGFNTVVNLFCEDKSNTSIAIDRSYKTPSDQAVFKNFAGQLNNNHIGMWLFDH